MIPTLGQMQPDPLGEALGLGLQSAVGSFMGAKKKQEERKGLRTLGEQLGIPEEHLDAFTQLSPEMAKVAITALGQRQQAVPKEKAAALKEAKERRESEILAKHQRGEQLTPEEQSQLSPTSLRTLIGAEKPVFEPTEEKLEAERVSKLATEVESDFKGVQSEEQRLNRMEKLSEKGNLTTPLMVKTLEVTGLPLGVLGNPESEEYTKLEADFLRDVRNVFPGGRITNYEIQAYLKTVPSLLNSPEGKAAIIRNRRLHNEAKKLRYNAYREVLEENKGKKPRNLGLLIEDKIGGRLAEIEQEFSDGIRGQIEKFQQPLRMVDASGRKFDIPPNAIEDALQQNLRFQ